MMREILIFLVSLFFCNDNLYCQDKSLKRPGSNYVGNKAYTKRGSPCLEWSEVDKRNTNAGHTWKTGDFKQEYLNSRNYCRNFSNSTKLNFDSSLSINYSKGVWCHYRTKYDTISWAYCDVPGLRAKKNNNKSLTLKLKIVRVKMAAMAIV